MTKSEKREPKAYRVRQVAQLLNLPLSTVYDLVRRGEIPSIRLGNGRRALVLVPADALEEVLQQNTVKQPVSR